MIKYRNPRTRELNFNSAKSYAFQIAFECHVDEMPHARASHRLVIIDHDLAHIVNAKNRVVVELIECVFNNDERAYYFRNERQIERDITKNGKLYK